MAPSITSQHEWFTRGPDVPSRWFPRDNLDADSFAFGVLHGGQSDDTTPQLVPPHAITMRVLDGDDIAMGQRVSGNV
jgi:hypothetical protein